MKQLQIVAALTRRGTNEILRVPGAALPGVLAPTIFIVGLSAVFGRASRLPGFTADDFRTFIVPVGFLQGAGFTGAATGVNLARDIEQGWFTSVFGTYLARLLMTPWLGSKAVHFGLPSVNRLVSPFVAAANESVTATPGSCRSRHSSVSILRSRP